MAFELTLHAQIAAEERAILPEWICRTFELPELVLPDPDDPTLERRFRQIPEFGNRVLRLVVNPAVDPARIVSVFFDRRMKGKL